MKILILQPVKGKFFLRTTETATADQVATAEGLGLEIASQRDKGIKDDVVGQPYSFASAARADAETLRPRVKVLSARMLRAMADDALEAGQ